MLTFHYVHRTKPSSNRKTPKTSRLFTGLIQSPSKPVGFFPQCPVDFGLRLDKRQQNIVFYGVGTHTKYTCVYTLDI